MKKLVFVNEGFEADQIVKTNDSVIGFTNSKKVFEFRGVSDFSGFRLEEGQEYDIPAMQLDEQVAQLRAEKEELAITLDLVLTEIIPNLLGGG